MTYDEPGTLLSHSTSVEYIAIEPTRGVLLDARAGTYYELNATGSSIWLALAEPIRLEQLVLDLQSRFTGGVADDVATFVGELADRGLLRLSL